MDANSIKSGISITGLRSHLLSGFRNPTEEEIASIYRCYSPHAKRKRMMWVSLLLVSILSIVFFVYVALVCMAFYLFCQMLSAHLEETLTLWDKIEFALVIVALFAGIIAMIFSIRKIVYWSKLLNRFKIGDFLVMSCVTYYVDYDFSGNKSKVWDAYVMDVTYQKCCDKFTVDRETAMDFYDEKGSGISCLLVKDVILNTYKLYTKNILGIKG